MRINENDENLMHLLRTVYPGIKEGMSVQKISEVMQKDGDDLRRLKTMRQSQAAKKSWRENRHNFMRGINRFHRNNQVTDLASKVKDRLTSIGKISPFKGEEASDSDKEPSDKMEWYNLTPKGHFDIYEFLGEITLLENAVYEVASEVALEEQFVESAIFADKVLEDLSELKKRIKENNPIPEKILETLLLILYNNDDGNKGSLSEGFSKLLRRPEKIKK